MSSICSYTVLIAGASNGRLPKIDGSVSVHSKPTDSQRQPTSSVAAPATFQTGPHNTVASEVVRISKGPNFRLYPIKDLRVA